MSKDYLVPLSIFLGALLLGGVVLYVSRDDAPSAAPSGEPSGTPSSEVAEVTEEDHIRGNKDASVTIIEYSDLECPFCNRFHPTISKATEDNDVRWVYRHFPLTSIHQEARPAALASECVADQAGDEGFWRFVDTMFENQSSLGSDLYEETALSIGVNIGEFRDCMSSEKFADKVDGDMRSGQEAGVTGTPASFVNGTMIGGAVPLNQLQSAIDSAR